MKIVGNMVGMYSPLGKTFIITDENNNEYVGVVVDQETIFTARDTDVAIGKVYASSNGVSVGTHECSGGADTLDQAILDNMILA